MSQLVLLEEERPDLGTVGAGKAGSVLSISLWQPWATLVAIGAKRIETRSWPLSHRGILAVHATQKFDPECRALCREEPFRSCLAAAGYESADSLPRGAVVALVNVTRCRATSRPAFLPGGDETFHWVSRLSVQERAFGNYSPDRYGWDLELVQTIEPPIPATGGQRLWGWKPPAGFEVPR